MQFQSYYRKIQIPSCELFELGPLGEQIGEGKQGTIYSLKSNPDLVFKRYRKAVDVDEDTLTRLIEWAGKLKGSERSLIENTTAWPKALVREWGEVIGITMPKAPERFTYPQPDGRRALTNISTAITLDRSHVRKFMPVPSDVQRLVLALSLCRLLLLFERDGLLFVDLSAKNILWTLTPQPEVFLLDCDSILLKDRLGSVRAVRTLNWHDPWFKDQPSHEEVRGLFTLIFARLVFTIQHPNDESPIILPKEHFLAKYFQDLVTAGYSENLSSRPSMAEWQKRIRKVFWQEKAVYNSGMAPLFSKGELKTQIRLFFKLIGSIIVELLRKPLRILFIAYISLIIILLAGIRTHQAPQSSISTPPVALQPLSRKIFKGFSGFKGAIQWSYDSRYIILGTASNGVIKGEIYIFDVLTGDKVFDRQSSTEGVKALAWSPDGNQIAVGTNQGSVHVIDINTGKNVLTYTLKKGEPVSQLAWSPDGLYLAELSRGQAQLLDPVKGQINPKMKVSNVEYLAWSPDGKSLGMLVIPYSNGHEVQIWDVSTGQKRQTIGRGFEVGYLFAWSPDGTRIAVPDGRGVIHVWDAATGKVLVTQGKSNPGNLGMDITLDWSPDGKYIATDGIEILDANTGNHVRTYRATEQATKILWSPDGRYIMAAEDAERFTQDGGVLEIWQVGK